LSKRFLNGLFGPDLPVWACELTPQRAVVVRSADNRRSLRASAARELEPGALVPRLRDVNILDSTAVRSAVGKALEQSGFFGSEIVLVVPDDAVRVALVDVESFPSAESEQLAFVRWKFRKSVPFDVNTARVSWEKLSGDGVNRLLAALAPESVIRQYEEIVESFGLHAGRVVGSTLGALGLVPSSRGDVMFINKSDAAITTSVLSDGRIRFYRKVPAQSVYDAAYPTFVYYQDKLGGSELTGLIWCGGAIDDAEQAELERGLGRRIEALLSGDVEDTYKPALGALQQ
jgi:type IV pilus assembly protein PilM